MRAGRDCPSGAISARAGGCDPVGASDTEREPAIEVSMDHPERVASWLGQVFGGPPAYSERYGEYDRMISQHLDKALTPEQRARWVLLLARSADEVGLPADAEFRAAFTAYLEWGSRSHDDVSAHADAILARLKAGTMPCDGAWPPERVAVFERWLAAGTPT